ncbi:unnamed protein product [Darwinula stevensoni]|uniref:DNA topoisomerase 1 n=1 Tax=Darwinula stevensoni TaxID=69355 RepID=A0A7R8XEU5_9CRUS|nr:unnamed protein product [Darwinula stevensoni]CAG0889927.1 unnamed protein product [Darwinula stevensoni]
MVTDERPSTSQGRESSSTGQKRRKLNDEENDDGSNGETIPKKKSKGEKNDVNRGASTSKEEKKNVEERRKWWKEGKSDNRARWTFLEHNGPVFAPEYEPLPKDVTFYYDENPMMLSPRAEEVATLYAKMLNHQSSVKSVFKRNFRTDWRKVMTEKERKIIKELEMCNFQEISAHFMKVEEKKKNMSEDEKVELQNEKKAIEEKYGFCIVDGRRQRIKNYKVEPPGLFRGRGRKVMGKFKARIMPEDVTINCSKDSKIPTAPSGHKWGSVCHDPNETWLARWKDPIRGGNCYKYVTLSHSSDLKGQMDLRKYETARRLHSKIDEIRNKYWEHIQGEGMLTKQRGVAMYLIDKLALRVGNEKEKGETADTVGCCTLRFQHIKLREERDGMKYITFNFLGKDSVPYRNKVSVKDGVFKAFQLIMENKRKGDKLFHLLDAAELNRYLQRKMKGLTAKVFRTYNASMTLQKKLDELTVSAGTDEEKILAYYQANKGAALLCNHQRSTSKNDDNAMKSLKSKIQKKAKAIKDAEKTLKRAEKAYEVSKTPEKKTIVKEKKKILEKLREEKRELLREETLMKKGKEIALNVSKIYYLDPRITVAWCKKHRIPIEKIFTPAEIEIFDWAIDMATQDFRFDGLINSV